VIFKFKSFIYDLQGFSSLKLWWIYNDRRNWVFSTNSDFFTTQRCRPL